MPAVKAPQIKVLRAGVWVGWEPPPAGPTNSKAQLRGLSMFDGGNPVIPPDPTFSLGYTRPDATDVTPTFADGQLPVLTTSGSGYTISGDTLTITGSGTTIQGYEIRKFIKFTGTPTNVTLRGNRHVAPPAKFVQSSIVDTAGAGSGLLVDQCEVTCYANNTDNSRYWLNGINVGDNVTIQRCNIHDNNDAMTAKGNNYRILGNWVHDFCFRSDDSDHSSDPWVPFWTHNDGIQWTGPSTGGLVEGNLFDGNFSQRSGMIGDPNAPTISSAGVVTAGNHGSIAQGIKYYPNCHGLLLQAKSGALTNTTVRRNWFKHCTYQIQANVSGGPSTGNSIAFDGNRLYPEDVTLLNSNPGDTGIATQITATTGMATDGFATLFATTVYADDDLDIPAGWRGHVVQRNSPTSGLSKFNPALTPT
jgi:hypothetical protein